MSLALIAFVAFWLLSGFVMYGFHFAYLRKNFMVNGVPISSSKTDAFIALGMSAFGPCSLVGFIAAGVYTDGTSENPFRYGWTLRDV